MREAMLRTEGMTDATPDLHHKRILLKLSGEALCGSIGGFGIDPTTLRTICEELAEVHALGVQLGLVIGGGNIFRGLQASTAGMDRANADYMGMLATVLNALALLYARQQKWQLALPHAQRLARLMPANAGRIAPLPGDMLYGPVCPCIHVLSMIISGVIRRTSS